MLQRRLGKDGPTVGAIGYGAMSFAGVYGDASEAECHRVLDACLELGSTHVDTSNVYGAGRSEHIIGSYLKANPEARDRLVIASKVGITTREGKRSFDNSEGHLRTELEGSLRRLGVEQIPLYYIHRRDQSIEIEAVMETMLALREEGKIGAIGFSEIAPASLRRAAKLGAVAAVQSEYSLWTRQPELGMVQTCAELGVTFVAFSPVGRSMLCDRRPKRAEWSKTDFRRNNPRFVEPNLTANLVATDRLREYARQKGVATETLAMAWLLAKGEHILPIPGTRSTDHLAANCAAGSLKLGQNDIAEIEALLPVGFAHGYRYADAQAVGVENYC